MALIPSLFGGRRSSIFDPFSLDVWDPFADFFPSTTALSAPSKSETARETTTFANARIDWKETLEAHIFKADIPVVKKEEVKVEVEDDNILKISGQRAKEKEEKTDTWHRVLRRVPEDIGGCSSLRSIDFSENALSGYLPILLLNLSYCGNLNLRGNSLLGQVPNWIGEMRSLESLDLLANSFSGVLPTSMGNLRSLKVLNMSVNSLSGSLSEFMVGCANLLVLDLRQNLLTGGLPSVDFQGGFTRNSSLRE